MFYDLRRIERRSLLRNRAARTVVSLEFRLKRKLRLGVFIATGNKAKAFATSKRRHNSCPKGELCNHRSTIGYHNAIRQNITHLLFPLDFRMASKSGRPILEDDRDAAIELRRL